MTFLLVFLAATVVAYGSTQVIRGYALSQAIVDIPNDRSLHERPVPRGGGLAIVVTFCIGMVLLSIANMVPVRWTMAIGGGLAVALIGWLDDRRGVSARLRATVHIAAAAWAVYWLGGLEYLRLDGSTIYLSAFGTIIAAIGIVWWINLYNFMDGIDGLAGGQAVSVAAGAAALMVLSSHPAGVVTALLLAGAAAGFLALNWGPARIFMGDVGSGFLGFVFATLSLATERAGALPLLVWLLLSSVFLFDSTVTLVRRVVRGERWYQAHRSHAYQRLVLAGWSHIAVTSTVLLINVGLAFGGLYVIRGGSIFVALGAVLALLTVGYLFVERLEPMSNAPRVDPPGQTGRASALQDDK